MLGSPLLGTAVGLVLLFATTALLCSGITESISTLFQMRACYLLTGMRAMLDAQDTDPPPAAPGTPVGSAAGDLGGGAAECREGRAGSARREREGVAAPTVATADAGALCQGTTAAQRVRARRS